MKRPFILLLPLLLAGFCLAQEGDIDWNKAHELFRRSQQGEALTTEDQAYLDRAKEMRQQRSRTDGRGAIR